MDLPLSLLPYVDFESSSELSLNEALRKIKGLAKQEKYFPYFKNTFFTYKGNKTFVLSAVDIISKEIFVILSCDNHYDILKWSEKSNQWKKKLNRLGDIRLREVKPFLNSEEIDEYNSTEPSYKLFEGFSHLKKVFYQYEYSSDEAQLDRFLIYNKKTKDKKIFKIYEDNDFQKFFLIPEEKIYPLIRKYKKK